MNQVPNKCALAFHGITKTFPGVVALDDITFSVPKGEVRGLVGENGAGKSTLIKILCGAYTSDEGYLEIDGQKVRIENATDAKNCGIQVMHQEISVLPNMTVAENMLIGDLPAKHSFVDSNAMNERAREVLRMVGLDDIDPRRKVGDLSLAQQQMVNLARIISTKPKVVLLDEPTASLTMNEANRLFEVIRKYKESGISIIYISHYLEEVIAISDRITVLRDGKYIETVDADKTSKEALVYAMIGKSLKIGHRQSEATDEIVLQMKAVSGPRVIRGVELDLKKKEVLGLYGLNGAGKTETLRAIMGLDKLFEGKITIFDKDITTENISQVIAKGIVYIPEDRRRQGLVLSMGVTENSTLGNEKKYVKRLLLNERIERKNAEIYVKTMKVKTPSMDTKVGALSGGNQQKVIMARCISRDAKIYLLDEPTVGIDVGAREEIYELISRIVKEGASVILASSDITEILETCDRIAIIGHGSIVKVLDRLEASEDKLLLYAMGGAGNVNI
ncbi:MAG: sugar ABC transporter ATP-binding protein [Clostridia bacterium]